ncbi:SusC/RagA family TonB-linked outer membrane protein [Hymenobacter daeguensis]
MAHSLPKSLPLSAVVPKRLACALLVGGTLLGAPPVHAAATPPVRTSPKGVKVGFTGLVKDSKGNPLPGVTVLIKGTKTGTSSGADGTFHFNLPTGNEILIFSFIGFKTQEVAVNGRSTLEIKLEDDNAALEEVVVVGYGTQTRASLTGAVATVDMKAVEELPVGSLSTAIAGQLPGVGVSGGTARPGDKGAITVRNPVTLAKDGSATLRPLYVIDNVVRSEDDFNLLDQSEVEAISVLKDAAAAIYGARSNQGVVVVLTKRGKAGPARFTYSGSAGVSDAVRLPTMMSGVDQANFINDYNIYRGTAATTPAVLYAPDELAYFANNSTDWLRTAWKPSLVTRNALNVSGGGERATYFASVTYNRQDGNFDKILSDKWTFRASTDVNVAKGLKAGLSLSGDIFKRSTYYFKQGSESVENDMRSLMLTPQFMPFYINGVPNYTSPGVSNTNTIDATNFFEVQKSNNYTSQNNTGLNLTANVEYELPFLKGLKARVLYARTLDNAMGKQFGTSYQVTEFKGLGTNKHIPGGDVLQQRTLKNGDIIRVTPGYTDTYQLNGYLNYEQQFGKHYVSALAFFEQSETNADLSEAYRTSVVPGGLDNMRFATGDYYSGETASQTGILSYAGRINYNYASKYLLELAVRYDGSTAFAPEYRWGLFPSLSAGWVISEENFFPKTPAVTFLKLRGSFGLLGGDGTKPYTWLESYQFQTGKGAVFGGDAPRTLVITPNNAMANRRVRWDNNEKYNAGIDARFLNDRLSFTADGFYDHRYNLLTNITSSVPLLVGATLPSENFATVDAFGTEVSLGYGDKINNDLAYRVNTFFTWSDNKQIKVDVDPGKIGQYDDPTGKSSDQGILGYKYLGMFRTQADVDKFFSENPQLDRNTYSFGEPAKPGMLYYQDIRGPKDANGNYTAPDGKVTEVDVMYLTPKASNHYSIGVNPSVSYKGLSLQVTMGVSWGGQDMVEGSARNSVSSSLPITQNRPAFWADHWTPDNPNAAFPAPATFNSYNRNSEFWFRSSTTAGMRNATISYNFPTALVSRASLSSVKVFFVAVNPLNFYNPYSYKVYGGAFDAYPTLRSLSLGLNVGF